MKIVDVIKSNFVMIPVVASVYIRIVYRRSLNIVNLTDTINSNEQQEIIILQRDLNAVEQEKLLIINTRLSSAEVDMADGRKFIPDN